MTSRRLLSLVAIGLFAVFGLSGCVAIKSESASSQPGVVTISLSVCASSRVNGSSCIPPNNSAGLTPNTQEPDNGGDAQSNSKGQLVVGLRLATGSAAPSQFTSADQIAFTKSASYTAALQNALPTPTGFVWVGYISSTVTLSGTLTTLTIPFDLPAAADGSPFLGPFLWRAVVGQVPVNTVPDAGYCTSNPTTCFDSPPLSTLTNDFQQRVADFRVMPGTPPASPVAPGQTATVSFPVRYIDNTPGASLGPRTFGLAGSSTLPNNPKVTPSSATLTNVTSGQTRTVTESVTVPAGTAPGTYQVTLTATDSGVPRSNTATVTVVDKTAPTITIGSPTDGQVVQQGQQIAASFSCADEPNGSGLASCNGTVPNGSPIDTATPGQKTFTVTATDKAGNSASLTRTYTVQPPPLPVVRPQINISLSFLFAAGRKSTKFKTLAVTGVPKGATLRVTCKGKGCPKKVFKKKNAHGSVSLKPYVKKTLRKGIVLTVSVTKPGAVGMVKTITIRASKAPKITTACLQPGAKKPSSCG